MAENTEIGKHVAHVSANDRDLAENGRVHIEKPMVSIKKRLPSVPEPAFNLTNDGFLTISQNLDREQINSYEVTIRACDFGIPQKYVQILTCAIFLSLAGTRKFFSV